MTAFGEGCTSDDRQQEALRVCHSAAPLGSGNSRFSSGGACSFVQAQAAHALDRLLELAETRDSGQIRRAAKFIAAPYNGCAYPLHPTELRAVDGAISDDVITGIAALRWGCADSYRLVRPLMCKSSEESIECA